VTSRRALSLRAIAAIAAAFGDLKERVVFVGGTVPALYPIEEGVDIRPTTDVDCIVNVATTVEYYAFFHALRTRGFTECTDEGAPICRLLHDDLRVDVMPSADTAIGPTNRWYAEAMREAAEYDVVAGVRVRAITPLYFIATKLEAFRSRGDGDFIASHDLEDVLAVLAGLPTARGEITAGAASVELARLMQLESFVDAIPGHFDGHAAGQDRGRRVAAWLRTLTAAR